MDHVSAPAPEGKTNNKKARIENERFPNEAERSIGKKEINFSSGSIDANECFDEFCARTNLMDNLLSTKNLSHYAH